MSSISPHHLVPPSPTHLTFHHDEENVLEDMSWPAKKGASDQSILFLKNKRCSKSTRTAEMQPRSHFLLNANHPLSQPQVSLAVTPANNNIGYSANHQWPISQVGDYDGETNITRFTDRHPDFGPTVPQPWHLPHHTFLHLIAYRTHLICSSVSVRSSCCSVKR